MDIPSQTIIDVLTYLLPGFITAALVYSLTPAVRLIPFERVVQALIYTIIVQSLVITTRTLLLKVGSSGHTLGAWTPDVALIWSVIIAIALGLLAAWAANTDCLHAVLRKARITCQTSFATEWYGALSQDHGYVVLHLKGERRLYGWPAEWPSSPEKGHFVVSQAEWLTDAGAVALAGVRGILVRAEDVEMVEMMERTDNPTEENANGRQEGTDTAPATARPGRIREGLKTSGTGSPAQATSAPASAGEEVM
ncbi:MAG TPA: DUF6338 family protein [Gemmatimonadaceae bacterium]|nr:DUF6338 family protein [Gemmatimonadaceae bacterium]